MANGNEAKTLTFITLVLFTSCGVLVFSIVFILVKRQIRRVTQKNKSVRHVPAGTGAPKALKAEVDRRLARCADVQHEPRLVFEESQSSSPQSPGDYEQRPHLYRMVAVNAVSSLLEKLRKCTTNQPKAVTEDLETYLTRLDAPGLERLRGGGGSGAAIERLACLHRHACHNPKKFTKEHYDQVLQLVTEITHVINSGERTGRASGITAFDELTEDVIDGPRRRKHESMPRQRILERLPFRRWTATLFGGGGRLDYHAVGSSAESVDPAAELLPQPATAGPFSP